MTSAPSIVHIAIVAGPNLSVLLGGHFSTRPEWVFHVAPSLEHLTGVETPSPDLVIVDGDICADACPEALAWIRAFARPVILIGGGDPQTLGNVFAIIPRPFRLAELFDCIQRALSRPYLSRCLPPPGLRLTEKEAAIFACLAAASGGMVARAQLLSEVWGYGPGVSTRTLETHIGRLRRKLAAHPAAGWRVLTAAGGYRLVDSGGGAAEKSGEGSLNPLG